MITLVNKTARVINVDSLTLIPGVALKVGDIEPLLSLYPGFKEMIDNGEIAVKDTDKTVAPKATPKKQETAAEEAPVEEEKPRRTRRKKE